MAARLLGICSMSDQSTNASAGQSTPTRTDPAVTEGRYLYCLVALQDGSQPSIATVGVDDSSVRIVRDGDVGAVVHDCHQTYDTENPEPELIKRRVLKHQQVVDAASEAYGTPLPLRFNTVFEGGDASVSGWVQNRYETIHDQLESFAGTREYRISLLWDSTEFEATAETEDDRLAELRQDRQEAGAGKGFLLEKQYDERLRELKRQRREELTVALKQTAEPTAHAIDEQDATSPLAEVADSTDGEQIARIAVLADQTDESALGSRLDELVERDGVRVQFTGPWPPYTFTPDLE